MYVSKKGGSKENPQYVATAQQLSSALIIDDAFDDTISVQADPRVGVVRLVGILVNPQTLQMWLFSIVL